MNRHEELYSLDTKRAAADRAFMDAPSTPGFFGAKRHRENRDELIRTSTQYTHDFDELFYDILLVNHGVSRDAVVTDVFGSFRYRFDVLIDGTLHEMTWGPAGKRYVLLFDGVVLKENETVVEVLARSSVA